MRLHFLIFESFTLTYLDLTTCAPNASDNVCINEEGERGAYNNPLAPTPSRSSQAELPRSCTPQRPRRNAAATPCIDVEGG